MFYLFSAKVSSADLLFDFQRYRRTFCDMLDELERHLDDQDRRIAWLETIKPQLEAMGLVLVAHFKRLLPLIYGWLHAPDDMSCISVVQGPDVIFAFVLLFVVSGNLIFQVSSIG